MPPSPRGSSRGSGLRVESSLITNGLLCSRRTTRAVVLLGVGVLERSGLVRHADWRLAILDHDQRRLVVVTRFELTAGFLYFEPLELLPLLLISSSSSRISRSLSRIACSVLSLRQRDFV